MRYQTLEGYLDKATTKLLLKSTKLLNSIPMLLQRYVTDILLNSRTLFRCLCYLNILKMMNIEYE